MIKWLIKKQDEAAVAEIRKQFGFCDAVARVLYNRGLTDRKSIESFFDIDIANLHDPLLLADMEKATSRIKRAVENGEKITVYGDYDVDGITSVVLMYRCLTSLGANVDYYIPDRTEEGYGLNSSALRSIYDSGTSLIVTVDTGTTAVEEIAEAENYGLDVIVTDHHECKPTLPVCVAVVNPKRPDSVYPYKELAGVGVVFKLVCALIGDSTKAFSLYGDLVSIGTIADIMPLVDENRVLVSLGLDLLRKRPSCGIKALLEASGGYKHGQITASTIAFQVAPRINAAGRIGDPKRSVELLLCEDPEQAASLAEGLCDENRTRRQMEADIIADVEKMLENRNPSDRIIVVGSENWHHGVIGIVASKIVEKYHLPCILVCFDGDRAKGSARSIKDVSMFELLTQSSRHLEKFGGHEMAAGLTLARKDFDGFVRDITAIANEKITDDMMIPVVESECEIPFSEISLDTVHELQRLEPFGTGNPTPNFAFGNVVISDIIAVGAGMHLKLTFSYSGQDFSAMLFGTTLQDFDFATGDTVDIVFSMSENFFNNRYSLNMSLKRMRLCEETEKKEADEENLYNRFISGDKEDGIVLTRKEFTAVYRHLHRNYVNARQTRYMPHALARGFARKGLEGFGFCKLMLCLNILSELGIIEYAYNENVNITFRDTQNKKNLADSKTWRAVGGE
ncbi:MAG: single-stranded-DNA-specific exonuclease RecJ [Eubacteriales bacterium]|nr:single-stranded-DNA-specific exonuclease RecJ [Eubacteriales bacterium]